MCIKTESCILRFLCTCPVCLDVLKESALANGITHKQSSVPGKVPTTTQLVLGELAINTTDGKLFLKKNVSGTETIVEIGVDPTARVAAIGGTASGLTLNDGYAEEVFAISGTTPALSPTKGSIQTWALTGNSTPTLGTWGSGQSMTLLIDDGTAYSINWASTGIVWKTGGGTAPVLLTTGYTALALVKVGTAVYGWLAGDA